MGFPAVGVEGAYRNNIQHARAFFHHYHVHAGEHRYRVYNLCAERVYEGRSLGGDAYPECMRHYPFDDHNACCLAMIRPFCRDVAEWLAQHPDNGRPTRAERAAL